MGKDLVAQKIVEILDKYGDEYGLEDYEKERLSTLISIVARSNPEIRSFFYSEVAKIAHEVKRILDKQVEELLCEISGKKKTPIIN